jgi:parallel beta-helix repeat protein
MKRKAFMLILRLSLAISIITTISYVDLTKANYIPVSERLPINQAYIRSDGSIDPPTLPIEHSGNTYNFKESVVNCSITVEKDDVVVDGNGFSMSLPSYGEKDANGLVKSAPALINIANHTNVTVRNFQFQNASTTIYVMNSSHINIIENRVTNCSWIYLHSCTNCSIIKNIMENNTHGLYGYDNNFINIRYNQISGSSWHAIVAELSNSTIIGNIFLRNNGRALCYLQSYNRVIGNVFQDNEGGILSYQESNEIHHNNFINNVLEDIAINAPNILDDGKEGNYWSSNRDSKPLVIPSVFISDNASNVDNFPQINPYIFDYQPPVVSVVSPEYKTYDISNVAVNFSASKEISRATYSLDGNESGSLQNGCTLTGLSLGVHKFTVYAEDTFGNIGTSETITFIVANPSLSPNISPSPSQVLSPIQQPTTIPNPQPLPQEAYCIVVLVVAVLIVGVVVLFLRNRNKTKG